MFGILHFPPFLYLIMFFLVGDMLFCCSTPAPITAGWEADTCRALTVNDTTPVMRMATLS